MDFGLFAFLIVLSLAFGLIALVLRGHVGRLLGALLAFMGALLAMWTYVQLGQDGGIAVSYQSTGTPIFVNDFFALSLVPAIICISNLIIIILKSTGKI